jgi:transcriptional regulator GlxA family with amidase domain
VIVPGGAGETPAREDRKLIAWLQRAHETSTWTASVCTGALLLGAAGLLNGQAATTHWAAMDELRGLDCGAELLPEARIVDNGALVISAGVSAGIDAALHLVSRLLGEPAARETARYLQYDWPRAETERRTVVTRNARGQRL